MRTFRYWIPALFALTLLAVGTLAATQPAISQIAPGFQQSAAQSANIFGTVMQSGGLPVAGADVRLTGPAIVTTKSDAHGLFVFTSVPFGIYQIVVTSTTLGTAARSTILVHGDINVAIELQSQSSVLKVIAQTTTHINITPANVASVNPSDYAFEGNASWEQLLDKIPGVTVGGLVCGGASTTNSIPNSPLRPIVLSINGTLPYETSTMLDGMPLQGTSTSAQYYGAGGGVDLSVLPLNGFDAADVVRGPGGDSPSIVDSVGGTFDLHAPGQVNKNQFEFSASNDLYGGIIANAKAAMRFGRLSATFIYGVNDSPGPFGTTNVITGHSLSPLTINGQTFQGCTTPSGCFSLVSNQNYRNCFCSIQDSLLYCCVQVDTHWVQHNGAISLAYNIGLAVTAQVFYAGSSSSTYAPAVTFPVNFTPGSGYTGSIAPGAYKFINTESPVPSAQAGSLLEEKITAYIRYGVFRFSALQYNSFDSSLNSSNFPNGEYTLYGTGFVGPTSPGTPIVFNGTSANVTFPPETLNYATWTNDRDFLGSYTTQIGTASDAGISYTTSYYNEPYIFDLTCGPFNLNIGQPPSISETTRELRLNFNTQISNRFSLAASWYSTQSTFHVPNPANPVLNTDSVFRYSAPRFGAVWRIRRDTAIRLAAGGGYALPQLFNLVGIDSLVPNSTSYTICAPNLYLRPETSFGIDLGTDTRLPHDTILSFDFYRTNLYGQIFGSTQLTGTYAGEPLYTTQYQNLAESRFEGLNVDIHHDPIRGFYWRAEIGLTRAYVINVPAGFYDNPGEPCTNCTNTYIVPGINFSGEYQSTVPYANGSGQIGYRWSTEKFIDLSPTYYGNNNAYFEPAFLEFDAHASYPLTKAITLLATFKNITGIYGQNYEYYAPSLGAPATAGMPFALFGIPYGSRGVIMTLNYKY